MRNNLNLLTINDDGAAMPLAADPVSQGSTTVYFRDLEQHLIDHIRAADAVLGCVAWLTSKNILAALAQKDPVALVVQKEDFLRPDLGSGKGWASELRRRYDSLSCSWMRYYMPGLVGSLTVCGDPELQPVRCVGNYNRAKSPAFPRMHHKFVVFCRASREREYTDSDLNDVYVGPSLDPYAVWTGSFNFTENAGRSLENALFLEGEAVVDAYVQEWARITALSEPLDWESDWSAPQWRIGS